MKWKGRAKFSSVPFKTSLEITIQSQAVVGLFFLALTVILQLLPFSTRKPVGGKAMGGTGGFWMQPQAQALPQER